MSRVTFETSSRRKIESMHHMSYSSQCFFDVQPPFFVEVRQCQATVDCLQVDDLGGEREEDLRIVNDVAEFIHRFSRFSMHPTSRTGFSRNHLMDGSTRGAYELPPPVRFVRRGIRRPYGTGLASQQSS
jgi:hypothetical protein